MEKKEITIRWEPERDEQDKQKDAERAVIRQALVKFTDVVLSFKNPNNLTAEEYQRYNDAGSLLLLNGWPLDRVLDLYFGLRPDATKPEEPTKGIAAMMVVKSAGLSFQADMAYESGREPEESDGITNMPFKDMECFDMDTVLPEGGKRELLP